MFFGLNLAGTVFVLAFMKETRGLSKEEKIGLYQGKETTEACPPGKETTEASPPSPRTDKQPKSIELPDTEN